MLCMCSWTETMQMYLNDAYGEINTFWAWRSDRKLCNSSFGTQVKTYLPRIKPAVEKPTRYCLWSHAGNTLPFGKISCLEQIKCKMSEFIRYPQTMPFSKGWRWERCHPCELWLQLVLQVRRGGWASAGSWAQQRTQRLLQELQSFKEWYRKWWTWLLVAS